MEAMPALRRAGTGAQSWLLPSTIVCFSPSLHGLPRQIRVKNNVQLQSLPPALANTPVSEQLVVWQPLFAAVLIFSTYAFIIWKSGRATDSRDRRMTKELELRRLRGAQLVRGGGADVEACETELELLKEEEKRERELIGFGTASPTSRRYSLELSSLPQTDASREYMLMQPTKLEDPQPPRPAQQSDEWIESLAVLAFTMILTAVLFKISV
ncbi:Uncharacterized protein (Fragment) [Durusdinium trenchii]|uniref:Uncharacterized protein n=1 Tax=Durusdinium trenchii TaxID=1381693 RepID=A0ABP0PJJ4_9DINO